GSPTSNQTSDSTDGMSETGAETDAATDSAGPTSQTSPTSTDPTLTTSGPTSDTTPTSDGTTDDTEGFIVPPDGGGGTKECDPWVQDCEAGQKCMPYSGDGDSSWESLKCTPVMENPGQTGDPCTVEGSGVSGIDSCDVGHMCWNTDQD